MKICNINTSLIIVSSKAEKYTTFVKALLGTKKA